MESAVNHKSQLLSSYLDEIWSGYLTVNKLFESRLQVGIKPEELKF